MSWLSDRLGIHLGNVGAPIGALLGSVIPGVGTAIGGALGQGLGALGSGSSVGSAALQGAGAYGVGKLGGAVARKLGGGSDPTLPDLPEIDADGHVVPGVETFGGQFPSGEGDGTWQDSLKGALAGGVRKLGSAAAGAVTNGSGGLDLGKLAIGGLTAYQALQAANASKRAGQLSDKALGIADQRWAQGAPLRDAAQARLLNPVRPDLSQVYTDPTNPFAARKLRSV